MKLFRYITPMAMALLMTACSSDSTLEDEKTLDTRKPMVFGKSSASAENVVTRAPLESWKRNFKVGVWKNFGLTTQQNVMNGYEVDYTETTIVDNIYSYNWYYEGISGQLLRYWDLSAFPYDFRGISPCMSEATITDAGITVNKAFTAQTFINDTYNITSEASEPCVVSHVKREKDGTDYKDTDIIKSTEINTDAKANATREVHMPFHHLVSKVGFRIFINDPQPTAPDYKVFLKSIKISVVNADNNFITASTTYTATNTQGLGKGTFSGNTTQTGEYTLLQHGYYTEEVSGVTSEVDFRQHLSKETAFDLCPDCMLQIPQGNIKLRVQLNMETDHLTSGAIDDRNPFEFDVLLSLDKTITTGDIFTWDPDNRYIYYLHIPNLHGHVIYVNTCEILPWDEVQTSDISIEL